PEALGRRWTSTASPSSWSATACGSPEPSGGTSDSARRLPGIDTELAKVATQRVCVAEEVEIRCRWVGLRGRRRREPVFFQDSKMSNHVLEPGLVARRGNDDIRLQLCSVGQANVIRTKAVNG